MDSNFGFSEISGVPGVPGIPESGSGSNSMIILIPIILIIGVVLYFVVFKKETPTTTPAPVDCVEGNWSEWSDCTKDCGGGKQTRARTGDKAAQHGGKACSTNN